MSFRHLLLPSLLTILAQAAFCQSTPLPPWDNAAWEWWESLDETTATWLNNTYTPTVLFGHHRQLRAINELPSVPKDVFDTNAPNPISLNSHLDATAIRLLDISHGTDYIWMPSVPGQGVPLGAPYPTGTCKLYSIECGFTQPTGDWIKTYPFSQPSPASTINLFSATQGAAPLAHLVNAFGSNVFGRYYSSNMFGPNDPGWSDVALVKSFDDGYDIDELLPLLPTPYTPECKSLNFAKPSSTSGNYVYFVADFSNPQTHEYFNGFINDPANSSSPIVAAYNADPLIVPCGASIYKLPLNATSMTQLSYHRTWRQLGLTPFDQISGLAVRANGAPSQNGVKFSLTSDSPSLKIWALKVSAAVTSPPSNYYSVNVDYGTDHAIATSATVPTSSQISFKAPMPQSTHGETAPLRYDGHYIWLNRDTSGAGVEFWSGPGYFELPAFDISAFPTTPTYTVNPTNHMVELSSVIVSLPVATFGVSFPLNTYPPATFPGIDTIRSQDPWNAQYSSGSLGYSPLSMRTYDVATQATVSTYGTFMGPDTTEFVAKNGHRFEVTISAPPGGTFTYPNGHWDCDFVVFWRIRGDHSATSNYFGTPMVFNPIALGATNFSGDGGILWTNVNYYYNWGVNTVMGYDPAVNVTHDSKYLSGYINLSTDPNDPFNIDNVNEIECQLYVQYRPNPAYLTGTSNAVAVKLSQFK